MSAPLVIIPARMASTRLPGKPLADIAGRPMILHVAERARRADAGRVIIAAGDPEIAEIVTRAGFDAVLTDPGLPSGSDRVHAAARQIDPHGNSPVIINLQGDLPGLAPETLRAALLPLADPATDIGTLVAPIRNDAEATTDSVVKVACAFEPATAQTARALYFSRQPVPWGGGPRWHHVGVYAWRRTALERFVSLPESPLEKRERLEQLRALEAGMIIGCARIAEAPFGVDTPEDLDRARRMLEGQSA
ncbi:3-deoxy-manno-octulosonate cytidylyltransferase [Acetobacter oeni]|uniref:3-deoxy-manno-octulosonate cytidylyltransferase n=1 Tax=Acetobacter oeni TaxID=304077 RepID=A0A511XN03_9PROT|nr:3-deoxy-manno-octulosonate cytidylyltransferase [Acetobacter oeni]MBB3881591.1 3-deoxy-manno-octulosonate cytidylyltransferase (CMP-KDO synthetase) [Acetobacter oeni]NHO17594.1 3-deoxy-manno-octulosonate cytidylyltransferase [Acetobacter oeni]GBR04904.1 3-deoxy-D-manno-octulosonate cytidylyltransferase [Acetobacter oeni LMG 21952]GEN64332.1 3-deoxy-manno-octulosonate cytidylyltransferase [Acetobacter oeni]